MLTTLRIKNLALVDDLTVDLQPGYNAITGETGAGKSILIGALQLVLGERADRQWIRHGSESCTVEAVFDVQRLPAPLASYLADEGLEPCEADQLRLKRTFSQAGTNRQFVNGSPTSLQVLAHLGDWLVDLHGPHDHQSLLRPARQLELLDAYGNLTALRAQFAHQLGHYQQLLHARETLGLDAATYARQLDLLRHQVNEIDAARLQPDEDESLLRDHGRAANASRLLELGQIALQQLAEEESSVLHQAGQLGRTLQELQRLDPSAARLLSLQDQSVAFLRDLQSDLRHFVDRLDIDPAHLQELEARLSLIQSLKRKYGPTLAAVLESAERARRELQQLEGRDADLERLQAEIHQTERDLLQRGEQLSARRRRTSPRLVRAVTTELTQLGFLQSRFDIALSSPDSPLSERLSPSGLDTIEFLFSPNPGEPLKPLRTIASAGEISRVMLAIKTALAAQDQVPLLVFDEVDANLGGETAVRVGRKMSEIGRQRQVLCITHLAPVAAPARAHFVVTKQVRSGRTFTEVQAVQDTERIAELARMLGGPPEAARPHAQALLRHPPP